MPTLRKHSLVVRLLLWIGAAALVVFTLIGSVVLWAEYNSLVRARAAEGANVLDAAAQGPLAVALWNLDERTLKLYVDRFVQSGLIVAAEVRDASGRVMARADRVGYAPDRPADRRPLLGRDGRERIGELITYESLEPLRPQILVTVGNNIAAEALKLLALTLAVYWVVNRLVMRRLTRLRDQVQSANTGQGSLRLTDVPGELAARDEIGVLVQAANQALQAREALLQAELKQREAEAASRAKSDFLSRVSHELRTPLNAILGFTQALQIDPALSGPRHRDSLNRIGEAGWHLSQLINDLLDMSRIDAATLKVRSESVDVGRISDEALGMVRAQAAMADVNIDSTVANGLYVQADALRLRQVLVNLLSNAIKYNRPKGRVTLGTSTQPDGRIETWVIDTGEGMSEAKLKRLFEPFDRLGREHSGTPGTGLGLVIARNMVELMGGSLAVLSLEGQGSTFTINLPPALDPVAPAPAATALQTPRRGTSRTVVYVEDDAVNVEVMRALLLARPAITLVVASTIAEGLRVARDLCPDLVLLDMNLPDGSGLDFLRRRKSEGLPPDLPVLVLSGDLSEDVVERALSEGAVAYVAKPLDFPVVLTEIDAILEASR